MRDHTHAIGKAFAAATTAEPSDLLGAALQAHRYIERFRVSDPDGSYWISEPDAGIDLGFENGSAGIAYFYLQLYKSTHDTDYLRIAQEGYRYIHRHWKQQLSISTQMPNVNHFALNVSSGVGSIANALLAYHDETQDGDSLATLREIGAYLASTAEQTNDEVRWSGLPYFSLGDSGIALLMLRIADRLGDDDLRSLAIAAAKTIMKLQAPHPRGGSAWDVKPFGYPHSFPNFVIGTSGISFVMSVFYEHTKDPAFLESARSAVDYLQGISVSQQEGTLVPLTDDPQDRVFYLGSCHGACGTSKVYYQLYRMTGDNKYKRAIESMTQGIVSTGAPEVQSAGYWNNTCVCCGTAGLLQHYIAQYAAFGEQSSLDVAVRCAKVLLGEAEDVGDGAIAWPLAETRLEPDRITLSKGYMHGAAGIASTLLQLNQVLQGELSWNRLIDDPYPKQVIANAGRGAYR